MNRLLACCLTACIACSEAAPAQTDAATEALRADSLRAARLATAGRVANRLLEHLGPIVTAPGISAAVATGGDVVWAGGQGWADVEDSIPMTPDSRFRLASVSKLFTATLALRLIESGDLDPDVDIRRYVPDWPDHGGATITARQLAAHTAGINHYESLASSDHVAGRHYPDIFETLSFFSDTPLLAAPGEAYSYSSFGYALLNAVTEGASGQTLAAGLDSLIFRPVGLEHTGLEDVRNLPPGAVTLYRADDDGRPTRIDPNDQSFVWGASGMRSTPSDLVRFGDAFLSGGLVTAETRDWALTPARLADGSPVGEDRYDIGFGWRVGEDWDGRRVAHHAGSTPGARTILLGYPDLGTVVALVVNGTWTSRIETTAELLAAPFMQDDADGSDVETCPVGEWPVAGTVEDEPGHGRRTISSDADLCVGTLRSEGRLAERWAEESPAPPRTFPLVRVARRGEAHVFAIAYPWGLAQLQVHVDGEGVRAEGDIVGWPIVLESAPSGG